MHGAGSFALGAAGAWALAGCTAPAAGGVGPDGRVTVDLWHGQADTGRKAIEALVRDFNRTHPRVRVDASAGGAVADAMLQKVTAALASGSYPDIAYIYGADLARVARSPRVVDLTSALHGGGAVRWDDYWAPVRDAVTVNGKQRAAPALLDSLCVVYNKKLFERARVPYPEAGWTWAQFLETARRLTDPDRGVFGTGWPGTGDEDTVWRLWPMIWDLGGEVIAPDGHGIGFKDVGVRALETLAQLVRDRSVYIDPKPGSEQMYRVFIGGRMAMVATGPWQLPDIIQGGVDYDVVPPPTYSGRPCTISGPDTWTVFDNGPERSRAAVEFITWLNRPENDVRWDATGGSLPLSRPASRSAGWRRHSARTTGLRVFTGALSTARVRPVHPAYPQISQAVGEAVVAVLLGRSTPDRALRGCAEKADAALLIPR
ncbi:ABC transporter substrate-binding protein [Streptomyces sp. MST-110588]|uniref:ABC transporter substrate-binding protein n=1 Tax=Streptomyces sp. MST-110588 TaxID=2833628 RepID=UPI001F5D7F73|nr:ABC transporter substrate-binding protein [Streptomyces sp. MST-110588]UNO43699.1 ABC transporter substrate-binding protein [Streptomyces sp. MST-110588]